jgi:integrase
MAKIRLTDRFIETRGLAPPGRRASYHDSQVEGLALRVTDRGHKSFVLVARFPRRPDTSVRLTLGDYTKEAETPPDIPRARALAQILLGGYDPDVAQELVEALGGQPLPTDPDGARGLTLAAARDKARAWLALVARGIDPRDEAARVERERSRRRDNTFAAIAEAWLAKQESSGRRKVGEARRTIQREFLPLWGKLPAADITPEKIESAVTTIKRRAPAQAHNVFAFLRSVFRHAVDTRRLDHSPFERIRGSVLLDQRNVRDRVLTDAELRAIWMAAEECGYPYGPIARLLILTGQRLSQIVDLSWPEIDLEKLIVTFPASRMKGARAHALPIAPMAEEIIRSLPRFEGGPFLFTTTGGRVPVDGLSRAKRRMDELSGVTGWVLHDVRRTFRTHLSALRIEDRVRERLIAHAQPGLHRVYDLHKYEKEMRDGLALWEDRLRGIVGPRGVVVDLRGRRAG